MGKFVIKQTKNEEYTFSLKAVNGQVIMTAGEGFKTLATCKNSIESVKKNALSHVEDQTVEGYEPDLGARPGPACGESGHWSSELKWAPTLRVLRVSV